MNSFWFWIGILVVLTYLWLSVQITIDPVDFLTFSLTGIQAVDVCRTHRSILRMMVMDDLLILNAWNVIVLHNDRLKYRLVS